MKSTMKLTDWNTSYPRNWKNGLRSYLVIRVLTHMEIQFRTVNSNCLSNPASDYLSSTLEITPLWYASALIIRIFCAILLPLVFHLKAA